MGKSAEVDPSLMHVPPSQQSAMGPVPKGGELLQPVKGHLAESHPLAAQPAAKAKAVAAPEPEPEANAKLSRGDLEAMTKDDLVAYADDRDIEVHHSWLKDEIIDSIVKAQRSKK